MVSISHAESAELEFSVAVFASAIRCQVFWLVSLLIDTLDRLEYYHGMAYWYFRVHKYIKQYHNEFVRLNLTLEIDSNIYEKYNILINGIRVLFKNDVGDNSMKLPDKLIINNILEVIEKNEKSSCEFCSLMEQFRILFNFSQEKNDNLPKTSLFLYYGEDALIQLLQFLHAVNL